MCSAEGWQIRDCWSSQKYVEPWFWSWWICTEAFPCTGYEGQSEDDEDIYAEGGLCFLLLKDLDFPRFFNILYPNYSLQMLTIVLNSSQTVCESILRWWFRTRQFIKKTFQHCATCSFKEFLLTVMFTRRRRRSCCWREDHWWLSRRALVLFALQIH